MNLEGEVKLRLAKDSDLPDILGLFEETIQASCSKDYTQEQIKAWISSSKNTIRWSKAIKEQYFLVAEWHTQIVGFASLANGNYIDFMYTHKDHLRKGIANSLFENLVNEAGKLGNSSISSDVSITARPFFEKHGFQVIRKNKKVIDGIEISNYHMIYKFSI